MSPRTGPRLVMITPSVPEEVPEHAGGVLLSRLLGSLAPDVHLTVIAPDEPAVRRAVVHPRVDRLLVLSPGTARWDGTFRLRLEGYVSPGVVEKWFRDALAASEDARDAVAVADVVDLQWQEQAVLVPWLRRTNPRARITVVLHDVLSQSAARSRDAVVGASPRTWLTRARREWARTRAAALEARVSGAVPGAGTPDAVAVLSEKDAALLPRGGARPIVLTPPLGSSHAAVRRAPGGNPPTLLMVALLSRQPNREGFRWFVAEVLPLLRAVHPELVVRVAGAGAGADLTEVARQNAVDLLGFVPDLDPEYAVADVVVAPLRQGAGLKFKVVEALSAGAPVVTTPVGAEGIGPDTWFAGVAADPEDFAAAVLAVLADPHTAEDRAATARREVARRYGDEGFRSALARLWGEALVAAPAPSARDAGEAGDGVVVPAEPEVSVVVPAYNAEGSIGTQLAALAAQVGAPPFEVVVADNRSTDGTAEVARSWAEEFPHGLRVVPAHARQGVSHARNRGCQEARCERILICDADDRVEPNWVAEMARALESGAVVGSDVIPVVQGVARHEDREPGLRTVFGDVDYLRCGALGIRRSVWADVGGFDEAFPAGHEDVDFCRRLTARGYALVPVRSTAIHYTQRADGAARRRQAFHYAQGYMLLWTRLARDGHEHPVSFTGSLREALALTVRLPLRATGASPAERAHALGWAWGIVAGHLRYRVLGRPPAPLLWTDTR